jgi:hypothetical protein
MDFRNLAATRKVARPPKKRSHEQVSGRPGNRQRYHRQGYHRWKARLTNAHLPPEEIAAHQRNNRCGGGDQQKHLRGTGKPIDSAALTDSYACRQYHKDSSIGFRSLPQSLV